MAERPPRPPAGTVVYAVGDVHGRDDLLAARHARIVAAAAARPAARRVLVHLGDYVDRGVHSRRVIERLAAGPPDGFEAVPLQGNHEAFLLRFLDTVEAGPGWLMNGGAATLASYGVAPPDPRDTDELEAARRALRAALPDHHLAFLQRLRPLHQEGDYLFVHAGIRPWAPLDRQVPADLLWIRAPFLDWTKPFGPIVVHGHTITAEPDVRSNRIGIDTGAYASGILTCLVLDGDERRFLRT
ncbi:MAG: metallophosphoesterase [Alphaproteobacteria bacterium]|nr:metallophosphoesterase [Alphaproteobacteria bacterium]